MLNLGSAGFAASDQHLLLSAGVWSSLNTQVLIRIASSLPIVYVLRWVRKLKGRSDEGRALGCHTSTDSTAKTHQEGSVWGRLWS